MNVSLACLVSLPPEKNDFINLTRRPKALTFERHSLDASKRDDGVERRSRALQPTVWQVTYGERVNDELRSLYTLPLLPSVIFYHGPDQVSLHS